jgi:hypothetical protein
MPDFFAFEPFILKKITFNPLDDVLPFFDPFLGIIGCGAEITLLDAEV